jgi:hypothetical protein
VNGNLNLSRALGDLEYKKDRSLGPEAQIISGTPDFICLERSAQDEFVILCCDGVWDVKDNQEVVDFVHKRLPPSYSANCGKSSEALEPMTSLMSAILEELLDDCVSPDLQQTKGLGGDNMTAVLVVFHPASPAVSAVASGTSNGFHHSPSGASVCLVRVQLEARGAGTGVLLVTFAVNAKVDVEQDILLGFSERTCELEIGLSGDAKPLRVPLEAHLPKGSELYFPSDLASAKLFGKSNSLRVILPWRRAS